MCIEAMDTRSKYRRTDCPRKSMKNPGSKRRWKLSRVFAEEDEALKQCRVTAVRTIRKYLRREHRRPQLAQLAKLLGVIGRKDKKESAAELYPSAACAQPPGAMAPENTTQYLMGNVYEDMTSDNHTSNSASLQDSCLAFQQRDFEEVFDLYWKPE